MPYRRLARTDDEIDDALRNGLEKADNTPPEEWAISQPTYEGAKAFYEMWKKERKEVGGALKTQSDLSKQLAKDKAKVKKYLSHFIQSFNLAIDRGEIPASDRALMGIDVSSDTLPPMGGVNDIVRVGNNLIDGEKKRIEAGGAAVAAPTIEQVKAVFEPFAETRKQQGTAAEAYDREQEDVENMREEGKDWSKEMADEVEFHFRKDDPPSLRRKARLWGVVYVSRPGEPPEEGILHSEEDEF